MTKTETRENQSQNVEKQLGEKERRGNVQNPDGHENIGEESECGEKSTGKT